MPQIIYHINTGSFDSDKAMAWSTLRHSMCSNHKAIKFSAHEYLVKKISVVAIQTVGKIRKHQQTITKSAQLR